MFEVYNDRKRKIIRQEIHPFLFFFIKKKDEEMFFLKLFVKHLFVIYSRQKSKLIYFLGLVSKQSESRLEKQLELISRID
jgi:hypothetical protein